MSPAAPFGIGAGTGLLWGILKMKLFEPNTGLARLARLAVVLCSGMLLANCATVTRGTVNQIQIVSEPSDAEARTSIGHNCRTPCTLTVDRKAEFTVSYAKDGYRETSVPVATRLAGAGAAGLAGNILVGGVIGIVADAATGATLEHYPNPVSVTLEPLRPIKPVAGRRKGGRIAGERPATAPSSTIIAPEDPPPTS